MSTAAWLLRRANLGRGFSGGPFVSDDLFETFDTVPGEGGHAIFAYTIVTPDALAKAIAWQMLVAKRNPPILRGKAAARDPDERDRFRKEFAKWVVESCFEGRLTVIAAPPGRPMQGNDMASFRIRGTPPQMLGG